MPGPGSRDQPEIPHPEFPEPTMRGSERYRNYCCTRILLVSIGSPRDAVSVSRVCLHSGQDILPNGNTLPLMCCLLRDDRIMARRGHVRDVGGPAPTSPDYRTSAEADMRRCLYGAHTIRAHAART